MTVDVVLLPDALRRVTGISAVVFDVLRATTTIAAALAAGLEEIRIYGTTEDARAAANAEPREARGLLCGEEKCLPPAGFDLGNSPGAFDAARHRGRHAHLSTTNGTRAILAANGAARIFTGALVNASAVAAGLHRAGATDVILLCAGTNGQVAAEDVIGAGAVLHALRPYAPVRLQSDVAWMAEDLFIAHRSDLARALRTSRGGQNVIAANLEPDIDFAAALDSIDVVGEVHPGTPPVIRIA
jgi:2-phosphosulfolactate phosphatase